MGASVSNPAQDGRTLSGLIPVWRLRGLNPAAAVSARAVLKEYFPKDNLPIGLLYKVVTPGAGITLPA